MNAEIHCVVYFPVFVLHVRGKLLVLSELIDDGLILNDDQATVAYNNHPMGPRQGLHYRLRPSAFGDDSGVLKHQPGRSLMCGPRNSAQQGRGGGPQGVQGCRTLSMLRDLGLCIR